MPTREPPRLRAVLAAHAVLGVGGLGGPALWLARLLVERFAPARVLVRGGEVSALPAGSLTVLARPAWRRALAGTRLHRLQARSLEAERIAFDRAAARALPPSDIVIGENTTALDTLVRARQHGARTVLLYHNPPLDRMRAELEEERRRWGGPPVLITEAMATRAAAEAAAADVVVAFSPLVADGLVAAGTQRDRVRVARFGVDAEAFRPPARPPERFTVAFVGWLNRWKGYPYLVEAFRDAAIPGARLLLHGGTGQAFHHQLVARLRGRADVEVVRGPVADTLARSSVLVLPSVADGYGLVVLEAMACGLPVVVSDLCGAARDVEEGTDGFVVPARDAPAIRDRLLRLHDDPALRERMGRAARDKALARTWSAFQGDMAEVLEALT